MFGEIGAQQIVALAPAHHAQLQPVEREDDALGLRKLLLRRQGSPSSIRPPGFLLGRAELHEQGIARECLLLQFLEPLEELSE